MSLRLRLALAGALAILVALGLSAVGLSQLFGAHVERRAVAEMGCSSIRFWQGWSAGEDGLTLAPAPADPRFDQPYGGLYWQIEGAEGVAAVPLALGQCAGSSRRYAWRWRSACAPRDRTARDAPLLVLERSVTLPQRLGSGSARVAVGMAAADLDAARDAFMADLAPYSGFLALALVAAGWAQLSIGLRPLRGLGSAGCGPAGRRADRMGQDWPAEVRPVATEIDELLAAREAETDRARTRAADLAHGLKTPLQALMGEAARLRSVGEEARADAIEDTARAMRRTVDRELARARSATRAADAALIAAQVAERLIAVLRRTPDGARLDWRIEIAPDTRVALNEADLSEALGALAENAARHARSRVSVCAVSQDVRVLLSVTDDGPGIPPGRRAALPARHGRADESGTGLGLAIAAEIAEAAGGRLTLCDADPGLAATLELP